MRASMWCDVVCNVFEVLVWVVSILKYTRNIWFQFSRREYVVCAFQGIENIIAYGPVFVIISARNAVIDVV